MVNETLNLRLFRKRKQRHLADEQATRNRVKSGLGKGEKTLAQASRRLEAARLEGHRLDGHSPDGKEPAVSPEIATQDTPHKFPGSNDDKTGP